jgi:hemerythrin-like metal-binding protein
MSYFTWNAKFETGIPAIDEQHKKLVGYVNLLSDEMNKGRGKEITGTILEDLFEYTRLHFQLEERAFDRYRYSDGENHKKAHRELIEKISELEERNKKRELVLSIKLLGFLSEWVKNHILVEDMKYVPELRDKNIV